MLRRHHLRLPGPSRRLAARASRAPRAVAPCRRRTRLHSDRRREGRAARLLRGRDVLPDLSVETAAHGAPAGNPYGCRKEKSEEPLEGRIFELPSRDDLGHDSLECGRHGACVVLGDIDGTKRIPLPCGMRVDRIHARVERIEPRIKVTLERQSEQVAAPTERISYRHRHSMPERFRRLAGSLGGRRGFAIAEDTPCTSGRGSAPCAVARPGHRLVRAEL